MRQEERLIHAPLPAVEADLSAAPQTSAKIVEESGICRTSEQSVQILMIEDDMQYYKFVRQVLIRHSALKSNVMHAATLVQAVLMLTQETPDLILLDLQLPDAAGLELLSKVKEVAQGCPIVILTGSDNEQGGIIAVGRGAQDYLIKQDISNESLVRCLGYAIERRKYEESEHRQTAIRDFTSTLAHDLKVPMIGSNNVLEALMSGQFDELTANQSLAVHQLLESSRTQLLLVEKLLAVYRYETKAADLELESIDCRELILQCVKEISPVNENPVLVRVEGELPLLSGNRESLARLFANLLDNAFKFGYKSTPVEIRAELIGSKLAIQIHNSGPAIPEEVQTQLFRQFWHGLPGKLYVARTGLGLYLCQRIVRLHHGIITCRSDAADGTTITVKLPLAAHPH